jgi:hypothetical protein
LISTVFACMTSIIAKVKPKGSLDDVADCEQHASLGVVHSDLCLCGGRGKTSTPWVDD